MTEIAAFHGLLLRTAGRLPDELTAEARRWLADGDVGAVAQAVTFAALAGRIAVTGADAGLLAAALDAAGADAEVVAALERSETDAQSWFGLAPVGPDTLDAYGEAVPYSMDLTAPYEGPGHADPIDESIRAAVSAGDVGGVPILGVWRAWRFPAHNTPWPPPRRIYLVQGDAADESLVRVAPVLQDALTAAGETDPQVEVFREPGALPAFQRTALGFGALLYASVPAPEIRMARVFDETEPALSDGERAEVLGYLGAGTPLMVSPQRTEDVADPARGAVVPVAYHTDGRWVWPEATGYYLTEHALAPDSGLLAHIRAAGYRPPAVDTVSVHRALTRLYATGG
ncbi:hypothetical protein [Actinoplanes sp. NBRC 103695]|uniref:hypothetical protein n=1 Tax=Actinoplanes sp. NBRC 103695 TaxID=3032202 RepID=UPI0024A23A6C|nr:hypothetical protein [Actinoplanes sp. NBRC 103695]GLY93144.1 hypothetical protein Acsp02_04000 [Actinoplanes sp. NBRC 103695]